MTPWVGVGLTLLGLLGATSTIGAPAASPATGAARWLPPDGTRFAFAAGEEAYATEWARPSLLSLMQSNSPTFSTWAGITDMPWDEASYLRVASHQLDARASAEVTGEDLWVIDDRGGWTVAESASGTLDTIWEPGRLDLPADLAAGNTWTSEGAVAFRTPDQEWSSTDYRADYRAQAPTDPGERLRGCVVVAMTIVINQQELPSERTWCPGSGVIASHDGENAWQPSDALPRLSPVDPPAFDWSRADELQFTDRVHSQPGAGITSLSPISAPAVLPDGSLVFANQVVPDLIALDSAEDPPPVRWVARPGGTLTSTASFAGITVVTNGRRELVAYGPEGQWLWQARLTDLTRVPPVRFGADTVVVVTLDGGVTGYDLVTGEERWRATMGTEIRRTPLAAGDRLLVADAGGALSSFDRQGNEQWTVDAGRVAALAVSDGPAPVVAVGRSDSYVVRGYSLADGSQVWRSRIKQDAHGLVSLGDRFVLRDDDYLLGIDAASGAELWAQPLRSRTAIGGGERVLVLTGKSLLLLDADGRQVREWPHRLGDVDHSTSYLAVSGDAVVVSGPIGVTVGRTP